MSGKLTKERLEAIRQRAELVSEDWWSTTVDDLVTEDIPDLLAEVEYLRKAISIIARDTKCDDTWDFANRIVSGQEPLDLPYRMGGDIDD